MSRIRRSILCNLQKPRKLHVQKEENPTAKIPSSVQEIDLLLQESQYADCHLQTVADVDQIAVIFGSMHMIDKLKNVSDIQFDGTFTVVPRLFYQLFTVFINVKGHTRVKLA